MNDAFSPVGDGRLMGASATETLVRPLRGMAALQGRMLVAAGEDALSLLTRLDSPQLGLVLVGSDAARGCPKIREAFPDMALLVDRAPYRKYTATADTPFYLGSDDESHEPLFPVTLADVAAQQLALGATMAVLPMGFLAPGDASPLRAAVDQANELPVGQFLLLVPAASVWLNEQNIDQFIAILKLSKHPVAIALNHKQNPLDDKSTVIGYKRLFSEIGTAVPWLTDHSVLGAIAHGAPFGVFGFGASHRHIAVEGDTSRTPKDKHPHVFIPALMRWGKASLLRQSLFAREPAPACFSAPCNGLHPDRFRDNPDDIFDGGLHNVFCITEDHQEMMSAKEGAEAWWYKHLDAVVVATEEFATRAQRRLAVPQDVHNWLSVRK